MTTETKVTTGDYSPSPDQVPLIVPTEFPHLSETMGGFSDERDWQIQNAFQDLFAGEPPKSNGEKRVRLEQAMEQVEQLERECEGSEEEFDKRQLAFARQIRTSIEQDLSALEPKPQPKAKLRLTPQPTVRVQREKRPKVTEEKRELKPEVSFDQALKLIHQTLTSCSRWADLSEKKISKNEFFKALGVVFQEISGKDVGRIHELINPLITVASQFPEVGLILRANLVSQERISAIETSKEIALDQLVTEIHGLIKKEAGDRVTTQLVEKVGEYLWGIASIRGKGNYERRKEHASQLFSQIFTTHSQVGSSIAKAIGKKTEVKTKKVIINVSDESAERALKIWERGGGFFEEEKQEQEKAFVVANEAIEARCKELSFDDEGRWKGTLEDGRMIQAVKREAEPAKKAFNAAEGHYVLIQKGAEVLVVLFTNCVLSKFSPDSEIVVGRLIADAKEQNREQILEALKKLDIPAESLVFDRSIEMGGEFFIVKDADYFVSLLPEKPAVETPFPPTPPPEKIVEAPPAPPPARPDAGHSLQSALRSYAESSDADQPFLTSCQSILDGLSGAETLNEQRVLLNRARTLIDRTKRSIGKSAWANIQRHRLSQIESAIDQDLAALERKPVEEVQAAKGEKPLEKEPEITPEKLMESAAWIRELLDRKRTWKKDVLKEEKTELLRLLGTIFTGIGSLENPAIRKELAQALLGNVLTQYPAVALLLSKSLTGVKEVKKKEAIKNALLPTAERIKRTLDETADFDALEEKAQQAFLKDFADILLAVCYTEKYEVRESLSRALLGEVLGKYPQVAKELAKKIR